MWSCSSRTGGAHGAGAATDGDGATMYSSVQSWTGGVAVQRTAARARQSQRRGNGTRWWPIRLRNALVHYAGWVTSADRALLGSELRRIREGQDLTGSEVAAALGWSQSKISRMETGRFGASVAEVARLLDYYGVHEEVRAELLSRVARTDGLQGAWTVRAGGPSRRQGQVQSVESRVRTLQQYSALVVPGLLQAPGYVRAVACAGSFGDPEDLVRRRLARQEVLVGVPRPKYSVVLDERALTRWPGSDAVMVEQLEHLMAAMETGRVSLRVLGAGGGAGALAVGSFLVYEFTKGPPVAMTEAQTADLYLSADADITAYRRLFKALQKESLDVAATRAHLEWLRSQLVS